MSHSIMFTNPNKEFIYTGRNGVGACHGVDICPIVNNREPLLSKVIMSPVNSKGNIANCDFQFPISEIDNIIKVLRSIKMQAQMDTDLVLPAITGTLGAVEPAFPETFKKGDRVLVNKDGHEFRGRVFMVEGDEIQVTDQEDYTAPYDISQLSHIED